MLHATGDPFPAIHGRVRTDQPNRRENRRLVTRAKEPVDEHCLFFFPLFHFWIATDAVNSLPGCQHLSFARIWFWVQRGPSEMHVRSPKPRTFGIVSLGEFSLQTKSTVALRTSIAILDSRSNPRTSCNELLCAAKCHDVHALHREIGLLHQSGPQAAW